MHSSDIIAIGAVILVALLYHYKNTILEIIFSDDSDISVEGGGGRDIAQVIRDNNKNYLVLYGTQTGTAEDYAKRFSKELVNKFGLNVLCVDVENYDFDTLNELPEDVIVSFFFSTYGEGEFPDGAIGFEQYLQNASMGSLSNIRFTLFGLGNSTYEFFNGASKKALEGLTAAGAIQVSAIGEADDANGTTDEDYLSWKENTFDKLKELLNLKESNDGFKPSYKINILDKMPTNASTGEPSKNYIDSSRIKYDSNGLQMGPFSESYPFLAPVKTSRELFNSNDRNCIHMEIDISGSNMNYSTGDHLGVLPSNSNENVESFINTFCLDPNMIFELNSIDSTMKLPFPTPTTVESAIRYYLEISGPISRAILSNLVEFAPDETTKLKLLKLSKDKKLFEKEVTSKKLNLCDILMVLSGKVKWGNVPFLFLIENIPHIQPRYYSISSSSNSEKTLVNITAVVEDMPNIETNINVTGVTTNLLRNIQLEQNKTDTTDARINNLNQHYDLDGPRSLYSNFKLPVFVRKSTFRLPANYQKPVIMIGPGTGVAPFRGFIRDRVYEVSNGKIPDLNSLGKHLLFYGSRNESDHLYQEEWPKYSSILNKKFEMIVCHSRIPNTKKVYVQDKLLEYSKEILQLLNDGGYIYICGDAKGMAKGVHASLVQILSQGKGISEEESNEILKAMKLSGTIQEDVW
ncbi:hypothetical protein TBLA_0A10290 [Henningerozyma blattae CBS 6284]|uniref:NADPH--cytochrome P450 reductase n=1 Tax=Henningerozyma blattae (strain ATCC 34711 / CBS 6284 / DSM 70876 / NBRC 10599 / NRRL Y-10934 / UCD 77-7) TaxID=1071380 RepID=I2GXF5_HENB6|nr:hypothetical protein TBLA_0A10290 [Tetrapisispora blattae CBS 6284]CCH58807.1 hypothetical protein TBLA_0A10290 [Tetrapisispora blattae CBS 6284]